MQLLIFFAHKQHIYLNYDINITSFFHEYRHGKNLRTDVADILRRRTRIETSWSVVTAMMLLVRRIYDQLYVRSRTFCLSVPLSDTRLGLISTTSHLNSKKEYD